MGMTRSEVKSNIRGISVWYEVQTMRHDTEDPLSAAGNDGG